MGPQGLAVVLLVFLQLREARLERGHLDPLGKLVVHLERKRLALDAGIDDLERREIGGQHGPRSSPSLASVAP